MFICKHLFVSDARFPQIGLPEEETFEEEDEDVEGYDGLEMNPIEEEEDEDIEMSLVDKFSGGFKKVNNDVLITKFLNINL